MLKILGRASSINVRKVMWTCVELRLDFAHEAWGAGALSLDDPAFRDANPNGLVPVLQDDDFVLWESNAIIRYLATREGADALYPRPARERARVDQWLDWQASDLTRSYLYAYLSLVRRSPAHSDPRAVEQSLKEWEKHIRVVEGQLGRTGAYIAGATFSLADIPIALSLHRWRSTPQDHPPMPAVSAYLTRLREREGFATYCSDATP